MSIKNVGRGLMKVLTSQHSVWPFIRACILALGNPLALHRVFGAAVVGLGVSHLAEGDEDVWIHADFGKHSATAAYFLHLVSGVPFSFKVHAFELFRRDRSQKDPLEKIKVRAAELIIAEHEFGAEVLKGKYGDVGLRIPVHYSSVRIDEFTPVPLGEGGPARFAAIGRLVEKKGFRYVIEAVGELRSAGIPVRLDIYGDGPERGRLDDAVHKADVEGLVKFHGAFQNEDLPEMLRGVTAVVVPSVQDGRGDMDGVPTVIYEAFALGCPVVASNLSGIPEIVRHEKNGLLVRPADSQDLAKALERLVQNRDLMWKLGHAGRRSVEAEHGHERAGEKLLREFEGRLERHR